MPPRQFSKVLVLHLPEILVGTKLVNFDEIPTVAAIEGETYYTRINLPKFGNPPNTGIALAIQDQRSGFEQGSKF